MIKSKTEKIRFDGIIFENKKEARRYMELLLMKKSGMISDLKYKVPYLLLDGYIKNGSIIRPYKEVKKGYTYFENGDVLFAKITPCMENGKGCVVRGMSNNIGIGSTEFHVIRPKPGITTAYWIYTLTMLSGFRILAK